MSMRALVTGWVVVLVAVAANGGCENECFDGQNRYECNCTATCNGQPVTAHSNPCSYDTGDAVDLAKTACGKELSACPSVSCSCTCTDTGSECPRNQCS